MIDAIGKDSEPSSEAVDKLSGPVPERSGRILKIVVFVHGFQASIVLQIYDAYRTHLFLRLSGSSSNLASPTLDSLMKFFQYLINDTVSV